MKRSLLTPFLVLIGFGLMLVSATWGWFAETPSSPEVRVSERVQSPPPVPALEAPEPFTEAEMREDIARNPSKELRRRYAEYEARRESFRREFVSLRRIEAQSASLAQRGAQDPELRQSLREWEVARERLLESHAAFQVTAKALVEDLRARLPQLPLPSSPSGKDI